MKSKKMKSPYPYFGGKSRVADYVWERVGFSHNVLDPFMGSNIFLLSRPEWSWDSLSWEHDHKVRLFETVNDVNSFLVNFWRATKHDPDKVADYADCPVSEIDIYARHLYLVDNKDFLDRVLKDPEYYDSKLAGYWIHGMCNWIGRSYCEKDKPVKSIPYLSNSSLGLYKKNNNPKDYLRALQARLKDVRICSGNWKRIITMLQKYKTTTVFLDPPYGKEAKRFEGLYLKDSLDIASDVRAWALDNGDNPKFRIVLFGHEDEHKPFMPSTWDMVNAKNTRAYGSKRDNRGNERIWFSPHCLKLETSFEDKEEAHGQLNLL